MMRYAARLVAAGRSGVFAVVAADRELAAELESHLQLHVDDNLRAGMSPDEARRRALHRARRRRADEAGVPRSARIALARVAGPRRALRRPLAARRAPASPLAAIVDPRARHRRELRHLHRRERRHAAAPAVRRCRTASCGCGTRRRRAVPGPQTFALVAGELHRLGGADPDRSSAMAIYRGGRLTLTGRGEPEAVIAVRGVRRLSSRSSACTPVMGRGFTKDDDRAGGPRTVLLERRVLAHAASAAIRSIVGTDALARSRAPHGRRHRAGRAVVHRQRAGVDAAGLDRRGSGRSRSNHNYLAIAKLEAGRRPWRARRPTSTPISRPTREQYPADNKDWGALVLPLHDGYGGRRPGVAAPAARRRRAGAAHRVRQPRQPHARAHARPRQGNRPADALGASRGAHRPAAARRGRAARRRRRPCRLRAGILWRRGAHGVPSATALPRAAKSRSTAACSLFTAAVAARRPDCSRRWCRRWQADRPRRERRAQAAGRAAAARRRRRPRAESAGGVRSRARADAAHRRRTAVAQLERPARASIPASIRATC